MQTHLQDTRPARALLTVALVTAVALSCSLERKAEAPVTDTQATAVTFPSAAPSAAPAPPSAARNEADFSGRGAAGGTAAANVVRDGKAAYGDQSQEGGASFRGGAAHAAFQRPAADTLAAAMIIRTGQVVVEVDSLDRAIARVRQLASQLGGYVANASFAGGDNQVRSATLELKLPAARFDDALVGLRPIGEVETENVAAEDVGEEFVDVTARVANARRLEGRLVDLLARRTGKLEDVLRVERELARVREEIERYEGRLRYLRTRTAMSTLAVTVHEPPPVLTVRPGENPIGEAFRDAWRNFVALTAALIASLGVVIPLAAIALVAWALWRRYGRTIRAGEPGGEPAR